MLRIMQVIVNDILQTRFFFKLFPNRGESVNRSAVLIAYFHFLKIEWNIPYYKNIKVADQFTFSPTMTKIEIFFPYNISLVV